MQAAGDCDEGCLWGDPAGGRGSAVRQVDIFQSSGGSFGQDERMPQAAVPIWERVLGVESSGSGIENLRTADSGA